MNKEVPNKMTNYDHEYMITELRWDLVARIIKQFRKRHQHYKDKSDLEILQVCSMNYMISEILKVREKETSGSKEGEHTKK